VVTSVKEDRHVVCIALYVSSCVKRKRAINECSYPEGFVSRRYSQSFSTYQAQVRIFHTEFHSHEVRGEANVCIMLVLYLTRSSSVSDGTSCSISDLLVQRTASFSNPTFTYLCNS
jgi:hypothetical protein